QSFKYVGTEITWVGEGVEEFGHVKDEPDNILVRVDPRYFRPTEVELLLVNISSHTIPPSLSWSPDLPYTKEVFLLFVLWQTGNTDLLFRSTTENGYSVESSQNTPHEPSRD
ncbi:unnamed protein product, partial [Laminaria digitata]